MGRFEAVKGLVHITFANEDHYFKNSLACLNLQQNLYYELKQKDYEAVCFVNLSGGKFHITFGNDEAAAMYSRSAERGISGKFKKLLGSSDDLSKELLIENSKSEELLNRLIYMMKKERRLAVVFTMDALAAFPNVAKAEEGFLEVSEDNHSKRNMLLVVAPTAVDGSLKYFKDPDSIYRTQLFPAVQNIFNNYVNVHLYDRLKSDMPNRISYMNLLEAEEIENLVRYTIMKEDLEVLFSAQDYADCLWYIYNSVTFYNWAKMFCENEDFEFPHNQGRELRVIEKALKNKNIYRVLDNIILKIRELSKDSEKSLDRLIPQVLKFSDYGENNQQYLYWNNEILQRTEALSSDFIKNNDKKREAQSKLAEVRKSLNSPYICCTEEYNEKRRVSFMDNCIQCALTAMINKDADTFLAAVEGMHYVICICEEDTQWNVDKESERDKNNVKETGMICYEKIMDCQETVFGLRKDINKDNQAFDDENKEIVQIRQDIHKMEIDYPDLPKREKAYLESDDKKKEKSMLLIRYLEKKVRARNITRSMKGRKYALDAKYADINQIEAAIRNMRVSLSGLSLSSGKFLHKELDESLKEIECTFKQVNKLRNKWGEMDDIFEETYASMSEDLTDYDLGEMQDLEKILEEYEADEDFLSQLE